ncbi:MAG: hypothetical protein HQL26_02635 [Candidatus Omnitrophica bacterium]|nr:hypothetical protein [Candidatus Omnitrophota bacterium]
MYFKFLIFFCAGLLNVGHTFASDESRLYNPVSVPYFRVLAQVRESERKLVFSPSADSLFDVLTQVDGLQKEFLKIHSKAEEVVDPSLLEKLNQGIIRFQQDLTNNKNIIEQNSELAQAQANAFARILVELKQWRKDVKGRAEQVIASSRKSGGDMDPVALWVNRTNVLNLLVESVQEIQIGAGKAFSSEQKKNSEVKVHLDQVVETIKVLSVNFDQPEDLKRVEKIKYAFNEFDRATVQYLASSQKFQEKLSGTWDSLNDLERLSAVVFSSKKINASAVGPNSSGLLMTLFIPLAVGIAIILIVMAIVIKPMRKIEQMIKNTSISPAVKVESLERSSPAVLAAEGHFPTPEQIKMVEQPKFAPIRGLPPAAKNQIKALKEIVFQANLFPLSKVVDNARLGIYGTALEKEAQGLCLSAKKLTQLEHQAEQGIYAETEYLKKGEDYSVQTREVFEGIVILAQAIRESFDRLVKGVKEQSHGGEEKFPSSENLERAIGQFYEQRR